MGNTAGYITGALAGLGILGAIGLGYEQPRQARDSVEDVSISLKRNIQKLNIGSNLETIADHTYDAGHDIVQRNPGRIPSEFEQMNVHLDNTPFEDRNMEHVRYRDARNIVDYLQAEVQEKWTDNSYLPSDLETKGGIILALAGVGAGLGIVSSLASKKKG
ncbi:hypothetical protein HZA98_02490 [Candidatus Woesearchaeota archaeon]|nr:hypothetical protein [Candidatus Woesearchaeota archaeon]